MTIKLSINDWIKFRTSDGLNHVIPKWKDVGLKEVSLNNSDLSMEFRVIDKHLFFLSVIKYSIEFEEIVDPRKLREDVNTRMF